jgi:hypothetical protein
VVPGALPRGNLRLSGSAMVACKADLPVPGAHFAFFPCYAAKTGKPNRWRDALRPRRRNRPRPREDRRKNATLLPFEARTTAKPRASARRPCSMRIVLGVAGGGRELADELSHRRASKLPGGRLLRISIRNRPMPLPFGGHAASEQIARTDPCRAAAGHSSPHD